MNTQRDQQALIHLAWRLDSDTRQLIFGWVEILPTCFPPMRGHPFRYLRRKHSAPSIFVGRFPLSATEADRWLESAARGDLRLPRHPDKQTAGDGKLVVGGPFRREPENGGESSTWDLPFLPAVHGVMLVHGFLGPQNPALLSELSKAPYAEWFRENMFFDLTDHPEYLGALIMVKHPPVVRDATSRLAIKNGREIELVRIRRWPGTSLADYKLVAIERRFFGFGAPREITTEKPLIEIDWNGKSDRTAVAVTHPVTGIAYLREPLPFLRSISTQVDVIGETRRIVQSLDSAGKISRHYDVQWRGTSDTDHASVIGETTAPQDPSQLAWRAEIRKNQIKLATSLGLKWFDDAAAAQAALRKIIGNARRTFTVVDPYFGAEQIRDFVMAVSAGNVSICIVTSEAHLDRKPTGDGQPRFTTMKRALSDLVRHGWAEPKVLIMTGREAPLHDRFIIADDRVWLSGNSFGAIGKRASVLIELPNPQEVLGHLNPFLEQAEPFSIWISQRQRASGSDHSNGGSEPPDGQ